MVTYMKVSWKSGGQTLFPLAFFSASELDAAISPDKVASSEIVTLTAEKAAEA